MEACVGAHHLSRKLREFGHDARLMPAKYVRPFSKGQKNDFRDAEAIAEAVQRPTMKFVATKTADQLDLQALHRVRERFVCQRTGIINQIRAFMLERGIAVRQGLRFLRAELPGILATRTPPDVLIGTHGACHRGPGGRLAPARRAGRGSVERDRVRRAQDPGWREAADERALASARSSQVQWWPRSAVAKCSRRDATSAPGSGLVPKQTSTGDRTILGKRYPSAAIATCVRPVRAGRLGRADQAQELGASGLKPWIEAAKKRLHRNVLAIALANKLGLASPAWSVPRSWSSFRGKDEYSTQPPKLFDRPTRDEHRKMRRPR